MPILSFIGQILLELLGKREIDDKYKNKQVRLKYTSDDACLHNDVSKEKYIRSISSVVFSKFTFNHLKKYVVDPFASVYEIAIEINVWF